MRKQHFRKDDIDFHSDGYYRQGQAAINIKVHQNPRQVPLPLELGNVSDDGGVTWQHGTTDPLFTWNWIDEHLTEQEIGDWWWEAANDNLEMLISDAEQLFPGRKFYTEGRMGGWLVMDGATEAEVTGWDAITVSKWARLVKFAADAVADVGRAMLYLIYINVFEQWKDEQEAQEREIAEVDGGRA